MFSFIGLKGTRVDVRQPVFHVACRRRAPVRCVTRDAISGFDYTGTNGGDDAPGLDWSSSYRKLVRLSFFGGMGVPKSVVVV